MTPIFCNLVFTLHADLKVRKDIYRSALDFIKNGMADGRTDVVLYTIDPLDFGPSLDELQEFINSIKDVNKKSRIFFLVDHTQILPQINNLENITEINFCLVIIYYFIFIKKACKFSEKWVPESGKILFLMNKADKQSRIGFFFNMVNLGLLDELKWSLKTKEEYEKHNLALGNNFSGDYYDRCGEFLPGLDRQQVISFINTYQRNFDNHIHGNGGIPFDKTIFDDTLIQLVTETAEDYDSFPMKMSMPFFSEKIWISILNSNPFLILGVNGSTSRLEKMGFNTFKDFFPIPNYDDLDLENFLCYRDGTRLQDTINDYRTYFRTSTQIKNFPAFYKMFRDESWPEYITVDSINTLSLDIKKEIIEHYFSQQERIRALKYEAILINMKYFKKIAIDNQKQIEKIVRDNFQNLIKVAEHDIQRISEFVTNNKLKISGLEFVRNIQHTSDPESFTNEK